MAKHKNKSLSPGHLSQEPELSQTLTQFAITAQHFSGPLPPPEMLRKYEEILPGSADRIISMAERQGLHRQSLEKKVVDSNAANSRLGIRLGFTICVLAIAAGTYTVMKGNGGYGIAAIIGSLSYLMAALIYGKSEQKKDLQARQRSVIEAARHTQKD